MPKAMAAWAVDGYYFATLDDSYSMSYWLVGSNPLHFFCQQTNHLSDTRLSSLRALPGLNQPFVNTREKKFKTTNQVMACYGMLWRWLLHWIDVNQLVYPCINHQPSACITFIQPRSATSLVDMQLG